MNFFFGTNSHLESKSEKKKSKEAKQKKRSHIKTIYGIVFICLERTYKVTQFRTLIWVQQAFKTFDACTHTFHSGMPNGSKEGVLDTF